MLEELANVCDTSRIKFPGLLSYTDYRTLLRRTNLHVYFTREYVTSWGLFQALACGTPLLVNHNPAIDYALSSQLIHRVSLDNQVEINNTLIEAFNHQLSSQSLNQKSSSKLDETWTLEKAMLNWQSFINRCLKRAEFS